LVIFLGSLSFILLWASYDILTQKKSLSNVLMGIWMIAAVISGILYAIAFYLFGRGQNKANY